MRLSRRGFTSFQLAFFATLTLTFLLMTSCATPVGVRHLNPKEVQQNLTASILSTDQLSAPTQQIVNRADLSNEFQKHPAQVLARLHKGLPTATEEDRLFALAELSYVYAAEDGPGMYYLASAIYAYAFLFPQTGRADPTPSDPRVRIALDLYNRGIAEAFATDDRSSAKFLPGVYELPFGSITIGVNEKESFWGSFRLVDFVQAAGLDVRGLRNRYRWPGIGAPLAAALKPRNEETDPAYSRIPPNLKVPITAFLRIDNAEEVFNTGHVKANLELHTTVGATDVNIGGRTVPIEYELSSALAYTLDGSKAYEFELKGLLSGDFSVFREKALYEDGIFMLAPYRPGLIPVVFVHGTASSPARWAEMFNELSNDRHLWADYQFWAFTYNSGNPIPYSAGILAEALRNVVEELDPAQKDPVLRKMVLIGHSQGGLLTKLTVVDSGSKLWDNVSKTPFADIAASSEDKRMLQRSLFFKPVSSVKRVIFLATPHQGTLVAGGWIGHLVRKFISLPFRITDAFKNIITLNTGLFDRVSLKQIPRSIDNMDTRSPFIKTLSSLPVAPGVTAHSVIAVKNLDDPKDKWTDGVVDYRSAHVDGVVSEFVVRSGHSTQNNAQTIEEVRRILIEHLKASRLMEAEKQTLERQGQ